MPLIAAIREAERWSTTNQLGALLLVVAIAVASYWLVRRYLRD